jgi:predicted naringenin-chalcone synthase
MYIDILSVSTARPAGEMNQDQALELNATRTAADPRRTAVLARLYRRSTVQRRASVLIDSREGSAPLAGLQEFYPPASGDNGRGPSVSERMRVYEREALPLAADAAVGAIEASGLDRQDIAQIVTVSCTGFAAPGLDTRVIRQLGLRPTVGRSAIGFMGCHGAINGLRVASALARATPGAGVLLCAVELCTLHFHYGQGEGRAVANTLFADGAAAVVLRAGEDATGRWQLRSTGSCLLPDSSDDMGWRIGDHGFEMTLTSRVPAVIGARLLDWLGGWLAESGLGPEDVRSWAIHPGGPRVIDAVEETLGLAPEDTAASREILAEHGNMSSPTVLFILERLAARGAKGPCVALAFGPGLVVEAALFDSAASGSPEAS